MSTAQRGLTVSLAIMAALVAFTILMRPWVHAAGPWAAIAVVAVVLLAALVASVVWWRGIDEAAREAHKIAWFWGGCVGMGLFGAFMIGLVVLGGEPPLLIVPKATPATWFISGALGVMFAQTAGYAVAWTYWWLRR